jgi:phosphate transport system protein
MNDELIKGHTFKRYDGELSSLHLMVSEMGGVVLEQLVAALDAFSRQDAEAARKVMDNDIYVDRLEVVGDAEIIRVISRNSPMASDLRLIITVSKSISDLEKIGDEAVRIAGILLDIKNAGQGAMSGDLALELKEVGQLALANLRTALELFEVWNEERALSVIEGHRQMDGQFQRELQRAMTCIMENKMELGLAVSFVLVAKSLDRITHHALNLAEYALFEMKGIDLRVIQP